MAAALRPEAASPAGVSAQLAALALQAGPIPALLRALPAGDAGERRCRQEAVIWADALNATILGHQRSLAALTPWAGLAGADPAADGVLAGLTAEMPTLAGLPALCAAAVVVLASGRRNRDGRRGGTGRAKGSRPPWPPGGEAFASARPDGSAECDLLIAAFHRSSAAATNLSARLLAISASARKLFDAMEFGFLFDHQRELLSIGYRVADGSLDPNYYDLLASEARLASFVAIAKGDVPTRHWFRLGRAMTPVGYGSALISWSGSMFEYLMPSLVMRAPAGSLLEQTSRQVVRQQMKYGDERQCALGRLGIRLQRARSGVHLPVFQLRHPRAWAQARARRQHRDRALCDGARGHGRSRGRGGQLRAPGRAGGRGRYGWYEALDYTAARLPEGAKSPSSTPTWRIIRA